MGSRADNARTMVANTAWSKPVVLSLASTSYSPMSQPKARTRGLDTVSVIWSPATMLSKAVLVVPVTFHVMKLEPTLSRLAKASGTSMVLAVLEGLATLIRHKSSPLESTTSASPLASRVMPCGPVSPLGSVPTRP